MGWALAVEEAGPAERQWTCTILRDIGEEEFARCTEAKARLLSWLTDQRMFQVLRLNYQEFEAAVMLYHQRLFEGKGDIDPQPAFFNLNRIVLNYLSMVRAFLDNTETRLKRRYGGESPRVIAFKEACASAYDAHFAYRFIYRLRNYCQHCGLPVKTDFLAEPHPETGTPEYKLFVECERDRLLSDWKGWGPVRQDIERCEPTFPIGPLLKGMLECLEEINAALVEADRPELEASARTLHDVLTPTKEQAGRQATHHSSRGRVEGRQPNPDLRLPPATHRSLLMSS